MTIPQSMLQDSKVIWTEALLRFADIDSYGHVSNRAFAEILEGGRIDFIALRRAVWDFLGRERQVMRTGFRADRRPARLRRRDRVDTFG